MSRWNISHLVFYSKHGERRIIEFNVNEVTIITGGSNTGKSAVIDSIDYCLGSSDSEIASFITQRVTHIGCKWVNADTEAFIAREISKSGGVSNHMFIEYGTEIHIPEDASKLKGAGNKDNIKLVIDHLLGINETIPEGNTTSKISVRHITPYIFLDKEVIDSKKTLMHGLDDRHFSKSVIESLPYFLGAIDSEELEAIKKQSSLLKGIEHEEKRKTQFEVHQNNIINKCLSLINEASQFGLISLERLPSTKEDLLELLKSISNMVPKLIIEENDETLLKLQQQKTERLTQLNALRRKRSLATQMNNITDDFDKVLDKQLAKLEFKNFFHHTDDHCPICNSILTAPNQLAEEIEKSINILNKEKTVVKKHKPNVNTFIQEIDNQIEEIQNELSRIETDIRVLIKESEIFKKQFDDNQNATRTLGRISYFLDNHDEIESFDATRLEKYKDELEEIKSKYGKSRREEKIQLAERVISDYATKNLLELPSGYPCAEAVINFFSKTPKIVITDSDNVNHQFANIGSDENYLSIHLALAFAFQKFFSRQKSPVPGVLILDQVSRPYYSNDENDDIKNEENFRDEDKIALFKHFDFIFKQVEKENGLQVIILEHAYLQNDKRFVSSTKYRWPKSGNEKLIPSDWPTSFQNPD